MSFITGIFTIKCTNCDLEYNFSPEEADFDAVGGSERSMGTENGYKWEFDFECECGNDIEVEYEVYEYPVGAFNNEQINVTGGTAENSYDYDFHGEPDLDEEY